MERTRNFVLLLFSVVMVASLVLFYSPTRNDQQANLGSSEEAVAKVGGETITVGELWRQKESYSRFSQGQNFPARLMLNSLIGSRIAKVEAERLGLTATDAEVAAEIREMFKPTDGKPFDQKRYEQNVTQQSGSVAAFEQSVRDDLSARKLEAFLTSGVSVSEQEVLEDFKKKNTKFDLSYVVVNAVEVAQTLKPTDAELMAYFEQNKASYYISVPQKKVRYIYVDTAKIGEKLPISDADLKAEYDQLPEDKRKAGVRGQEIVLRVAKPEFDGQVLEKATELANRAKKDGTITEEAFAELAKGYSENPLTAGNGGRLSGPVRENLNNPTDPYQRLLKMKPGEVTEPISYQNRYFILRRGEEVPKTFEDAKKELEVSLRNRRAYTVAAELAQKITDALKNNKSIDQTVQEFAAQANMAPADMIRETGYIKPGDNVDKIGTSPQFEQGIASLENPQDVGDKIPVAGGFAIPQLVDQRPPRDAEFAEVKDQLVEIVKLEQARARVADIAKQVAAGAVSPSALAAAAQAQNLKAQDQKSYILGSPLGQGPSASTSETLENAVYGMKEGEITKEPILIGDNWYIVAVNKREEANMDDFAKQRDELMQQMLRQKRSEVFQDYIASTRQKMESSGNIRIYPEALAKLDEPEFPVPPMQ